jgi:hypothetical protein
LARGLHFPVIKEQGDIIVTFVCHTCIAYIKHKKIPRTVFIPWAVFSHPCSNLSTVCMK